MNPLRIKGAVLRLQDGVCAASKHTTCPDEFRALWDALGQPTMHERESDDIPYVTFAVDGVGWRVSVNLMARTFADMDVRLDAA